MSDEDNWKCVCEYGTRVGKHDSALMLISPLASVPFDLAVRRRPQIESACYNGVLPDENLLHAFIIVGHGYRFDILKHVEAHNVEV